jgi:hypothetical protein
VQLRDALLNNMTSGGETVVLFTDLGSLSAVTDQGDGTYTTTLTSPTSGTATISGTLNGYWLVDTAQVTVTQVAWDQCTNQSRKKITILASQVTADLTNYPVLINMASDADLAADARTTVLISASLRRWCHQAQPRDRVLTAPPASWWPGCASFLSSTGRHRRLPLLWGSRLHQPGSIAGVGPDYMGVWHLNEVGTRRCSIPRQHGQCQTTERAARATPPLSCPGGWSGSEAARRSTV